MSNLIGGSTGQGFEKMPVDVWILGNITNIEARTNEHKKFVNKDTGKTEEKSVQEVRFVFQLHGYEQPKYSRWLTFSTYGLAKLYKDYLKFLAPKTPENEIVDLAKLIGIQIKVMYQNDIGRDGKTYNNIAQIRGIETDNLDIRVEGAPF